MTDPVLTEEEKGALLEGVSSGQVEVHANGGPTYADVKAFEFGPNSRIVTNSFPRLQSLNRQFATRFAKQAEQLLNAETVVTFNNVANIPFSEFGEKGEGLSLLLEFVPKPLDGSALINLNSQLVELLVETFYGGGGNDPADPAREDAVFYTPGETNVATMFGNAVLSIIADVWQPLSRFAPEMLGDHLSSGVIDCIDGGDAVICSEFDIKIGETEQHFHILWPLATVSSLVPVFEGQKRERDSAEDARWDRSLRSRLTDAIVSISSGVGNTSLTLRQVADLTPGDVINITNPQKGVIFASTVPVIEGRFGVHDGRYAIETTQWLGAEADAVSN